MRNNINIKATVSAMRNLPEGKDYIWVDILPLKEGADESGNTHVIRHVFYSKNEQGISERKTIFLGRIYVRDTYAKRFSGFINAKNLTEAFNACLEHRRVLNLMLFKSKNEDALSYFLSVPVDGKDLWMSVGKAKAIDFALTKETQNTEAVIVVQDECLADITETNDDLMPF